MNSMELFDNVVQNTYTRALGHIRSLPQLI